MTGLAASPGTEVEPTCSSCSTRQPSAAGSSRRGRRTAAARPGRDRSLRCRRPARRRAPPTDWLPGAAGSRRTTRSRHGWASAQSMAPLTGRSGHRQPRSGPRQHRTFGHELRHDRMATFKSRPDRILFVVFVVKRLCEVSWTAPLAVGGRRQGVVRGVLLPSGQQRRPGHRKLGRAGAARACASMASAALRYWEASQSSPRCR
jgi:hypothetical protein